MDKKILKFDEFIDLIVCENALKQALKFWQEGLQSENTQQYIESLMRILIKLKSLKEEYYK